MSAASTIVSEDPNIIKTSHSQHTKSLLERLLRKCQQEAILKTYKVDPSDHVKRAAFLCGLHEATVERLLNGETLEPDLSNVDRSLIHRKLSEFYLEVQRLPSSRLLYHSLQGKLPAHIDIDSFRQMLKEMGYVHRVISGRPAVILENSEVTFERFRYLRTILEHRNRGIPVYYVGEYAAGKSEMLVYAASRRGIHGLKRITGELDNMSIVRWLDAELLPEIGTVALVVLTVWQPQPLPLHREALLHQLRAAGVPCSDTMSGDEIRRLIELGGFSGSPSPIALLKRFGVTGIYVPSCICDLTPIPLISQLITKNLALKSSSEQHTSTKLESIFKRIRESHLEKYDEFVATEERLLYWTDIEIDKVLDDLIEQAQYISPDTVEEDSDDANIGDSDDKCVK